MTPESKPKRARPYHRRPRAWSQHVTKTAAWANWRQRVFSRDGYQCVMCPRTPAQRLVFKVQRRHLEPHHIQRKIDRPDLIHDVDNGVTLCNVCHAQVTDCEKEHAPRFMAYVYWVKQKEEALRNIDMSGLE